MNGPNVDISMSKQFKLNLESKIIIIVVKTLFLAREKMMLMATISYFKKILYFALADCIAATDSHERKNLDFVLPPPLKNIFYISVTKIRPKQPTLTHFWGINVSVV